MLFKAKLIKETKAKCDRLTIKKLGKLQKFEILRLKELVDKEKCARKKYHEALREKETKQVTLDVIELRLGEKKAMGCPAMVEIGYSIQCKMVKKGRYYRQKEKLFRDRCSKCRWTTAYKERKLLFTEVFNS